MRVGAAPAVWEVLAIVQTNHLAKRPGLVAACILSRLHNLVRFYTSAQSAGCFVSWSPYWHQRLLNVSGRYFANWQVPNFGLCLLGYSSTVPRVWHWSTHLVWSQILFRNFFEWLCNAFVFAFQPWSSPLGGQFVIRPILWASVRKGSQIFLACSLPSMDPYPLLPSFRAALADVQDQARIATIIVTLGFCDIF